MHRQPRNRPQMPASEPEPQTGTVSLASTALVTLALLIASVVMFTICMRLLTPAIATFEDRWPHEPFKFLDKRQGHLPRAPLMPWWVERVIV